MKKHLLVAAMLGMASYTNAQVSGGVYLIAENSYIYNGSAFILNDTLSYKYNSNTPRQYLPELAMWGADTIKYYHKSGGVPTQRGHGYSIFNGQFQPVVHASENVVGSTVTSAHRYNRTFNSAGKVLTEEFQRKLTSGSSMENVYRFTKTYMPNGDVASLINEQWSPGLNQYENAYRTAYTYDASNLLMSEEQEDYNGTTWAPSTRIDYTYVAGKKTEMLYRMHDGSSYVNGFKTEYTYDANGRLTGSESMIWGGTAWTNTTNQLTTYDGNGNVATEETRNWNGTTYTPNTMVEFTHLQNKVSSMVSKMWDGNAYTVQSGSDSMHYYYEFAISVPQAPAAIEQGISVYPNPAGSYINLKLAPATLQHYTAVVMDATGKAVKVFAAETNGNPIHRLDISNLPTGNYMLRVNAGGSMSTEKIVIAR